MFTDGRIKTYDAVRGIGSIELANNTQELNFQLDQLHFQLDQLPSPEIAPQVGERLKFRIIEEQNTIQLDNMVRLDIKHQEEFVSEVVALPSLASTSTIVNPARNTIFFSPTLWLILVTAIGFMLFGEI
ncbi:hypothetical protein [Acinetobacter variabilis]|uniref:hypothetical protein n=1 Tax=Acinetobacter variabilis TaxID=70346 RepID=UPI0028ABFE1B|nr:hypothetical protein [Acinetobacter variabilis]